MSECCWFLFQIKARVRKRVCICHMVMARIRIIVGQSAVGSDRVGFELELGLWYGLEIYSYYKGLWLRIRVRVMS